MREGQKYIYLGCITTDGPASKHIPLDPILKRQDILLQVVTINIPIPGLLASHLEPILTYLRLLRKRYASRRQLNAQLAILLTSGQNCHWSLPRIELDDI